MPRIFFALQPRPEEQAAIASVILPVAKEVGARPLEESDIHLTLAFLGEVTADTIPEVRRAAAGIAPREFQLLLTQLDWWKGAGVLCLLPNEAVTTRPVEELAQALRSAVSNLGLAPDAKLFRPHVTVARKTSAALSRSRHWPQPLPVPLPFTANGFVLMESKGANAGSRYTALDAWPGPAADM